MLDYRDPRLGERLREAAPGGFGVQVDTSGRMDLELAVDLLAWRGRVVLLAGMDRRASLPVGPLYLRDGRVLGFVISRATTAELAAAAALVNQRLAAGGLQVRVARVLPLERAADAHRLVERGTRGRVVLRL